MYQQKTVSNQVLFSMTQSSVSSPYPSVAAIRVQKKLINKKKLQTIRIIPHWNHVCREARESPSLKAKSSLCQLICPKMYPVSQRPNSVRQAERKTNMEVINKIIFKASS